MPIRYQACKYIYKGRYKVTNQQGLFQSSAVFFLFLSFLLFKYQITGPYLKEQSNSDRLQI